ncbi:MAG TPA: hypothetical protein VMT90_03995 [Dehalococcoidia bacterium]|nr:hypothetical protein [Dehalococcoidia bacterium]
MRLTTARSKLRVTGGGGNATSRPLRANVDCPGGIDGADVLFLVRHIAGLPEQPRPQYCPDIGPDPEQ